MPKKHAVDKHRLHEARFEKIEASLNRTIAMASGMERDLADLRAKLSEDEEGEQYINDYGEGTWMEGSVETFNTPIRITRDQAMSMSQSGGWLMAVDRGNGWLFIGNLQDAPDGEGNGCWHDTKGDEQHGPYGTSS